MASGRGADRLLSAALILMAGNALSRVFGLVREQVIAGLYGATGVTSSFATAATVPTMFYDILIGGAISAAMVPVLAQYASPAQRQQLGRLVTALLMIAAGVGLIAALLIHLSAPVLTLALGAAASPEFGDQTTDYLQIMAPAIVFLLLSAVAAGANYARNRHLWPALAASGFNMGVIAGALVLADTVGPSALAVGLLIGTFAQFLLQMPGLRDLRPRWFNRQTLSELGRMAKLYLPVLLGLIISQLGVVIDRNLAWRTGDESVAIMRFATTLVQLPLGLVVTATSFAVLADLSRSTIGEFERGRAAFAATLSQGLRLALVLIIPATVGLAVLSQPIVEVLFQRGAFDADATQRTALAFLIYSPQMPFVAVGQLLVFAFYARRDTMTPALVGLAGVLFYVVAGLVSIGPLGLGVFGLIMANTLQNSLHAVVLVILMIRVAGSSWLQGVGKTIRISLIASLLMGGFVSLATSQIDWGILGLAISIVLGAVIYLAALRVQRSNELDLVADLLRRRLHRNA